MKHPLHPMTVHVPLGLLMAAPGFDVAAALGVPALWPVGFWMLAAGVAGGFVAATFGLVDLVALEGKARRVGYAHAAGALVALTWAAFALALRAGPQALTGSHMAATLGLEGLAALSLVFTGHLGGELVYRYDAGRVKPKGRAGVRGPSS
jgi:uncharacterized membrane protein